MSRPQLLESVYKRSATESEGVAQTELDRYLESLDAKITQLQNHLVELASVTISADWLKDMVDFGSGAVELLTTIVDKVGSLPLLLGGLSGVITQITGNGLINLNKNTGQISTLFGAIRSNREAKVQSINHDLASLSGLDQSQAISELGENFLQTNGAIRATLGSMNEYSRATVTVGQMTGMLQGQLKILPGIFGKLTNIITNVGSALLTSFATTAVLWGVSQLISLFQQTHKSLEEISQNGTKAKDAIKNIKTEYDNLEKSTKTLGERYNELRSGVEFIQGQGYSNVSLSTDEYNEFLDVNKQIVDLFPTMFAGIDSAGNAYTNLGSNVEVVNDTLTGLLETAERIAKIDIAAKLPEVAEGIIADNKTIDNAAKSRNEELERYKNDLNSISLEGTSVRVPEYLDNTARMFHDKLFELANQYGLSYQQFDLGFESGASEVLYEFQSDNDEQLQQFLKDVDAEIYKVNTAISDKIVELEQQNYTDEFKKKQNWSGIFDSLKSSIELSDDFQSFSDTIQTSLLSSFSNLDYGEITEQVGSEGIDEFIKMNYIAPIKNGLETYGSTLEEDFTDVLTHSFGNRTVQESKAFTKDTLSKIFPVLDDRYEFQEAIGLGTHTGFEKFTYNITDNVDQIKNAMTGVQDLEELNLDNLKITDLEKTMAVLNAGNFEFDATGKNLADFVEYVKQAYDTLTAVPEYNEKTFADLFPEGKLSENAENYEKKLTSITAALEKYRTEGKLTSEEQKDLMVELQMGDISEENLSDEGLKTLREYISSIRSSMEDMTPEAQGEAEKYIDSIVKSYLNAYGEISDVDLSELLYKDVSDPKKIAEISDVRNQLYSELGGEVDNEVIATMIVEGDFSNFDGDMQSLVDRYHELEVAVSLNIDESQLEKLKGIVTENNDLEEARRNAKEASGETLTGDDYAETIKNDSNLLKGLEEDYNKKAEIYNNLQRTYNDLQRMPAGEVSEADLSRVATQLKDARSEMIKAETELEKQRGVLFKDQDAADQADLSQFAKEREEIDAKKQELEDAIAENKAKGYEKSAKDYRDENKLLQEENMSLTREKNQLRSQITDANREQKQKEIDKLDSQIAQNRATIIENRKAATDLEMFGDTDNLIGQFESQRRNIESEISYITEDLKDRASQEQYSELEGTLDSLIKQKSIELEKYQTKVDGFVGQYGEESPELLSNTDYKEASDKVADLNKEINDLHTDKAKAHNDFILAGFNEQLDEADRIEARIGQIDRNIEDTQRDIDKQNASKQDTSSLQETLSGFYKDRQQANERLFEIRDTIGKAFVGVDAEESSKWLEEAVDYATKANEDNEKYIDSEIARISSNQSRDSRIEDRTRAYEEIVRQNKGQFGAHEYYASLRKLLEENGKDLDDRAVELHHEYLDAVKNNKDDEIIQNAKTQYEEALKALHENQDNIRDNVDVPDREVEVTNLQRELSDLQDVQAEYDRVINDSTRVTPQDVFTQKGENLQDQLKKTQELAEGYQTLLKLPNLTDEDTEKYSKGLVDALTQIDSLQSAISNNINDAYSEQLRMESVEYQKLQQAATEYQNVINNTKHDATAQDYRNLISNGDAQIASLQNQIAIWKEYQSTLEENSPEWATAQTNIDNLSNSITGMTTNITSWSDAINNLKLDKINEALDLNKALQGKDQAEIESAGKKRDIIPEDYNNLIDDQTKDVELATQKIEESRNTLTSAINSALVQDTFGEDIKSGNLAKDFNELANEATKAYTSRKDLIDTKDIAQKQRDVVEAETALIQAQDSMYGTLTQQQESELNPLVTQYNTITDDLNTVTSQIKTMTDNKELVPQSLYDEQSRLTNEEITNLQKQIDIWEGIKDDRQREIDSGSGLFGEKDITKATTQINSLQKSLDELKGGRDEVRQNSIIAGFNDELEKAKGWERNLKEVQDSVKTSLDSINLNEADFTDQTEERGALSGLYESESYYASLLEDLYSRISTTLGSNGLLEGSDYYAGLAQQQHDIVQSATADALTNDIARVGTINPALQKQIEDAEKVANELKQQQEVEQASGALRSRQDIADSLQSNKDLRDQYQGIVNKLEEATGTEEYKTEPRVASAVDALISQFTTKVAEQNKAISDNLREQDTQLVEGAQKTLTAYEQQGQQISDEIENLTTDNRYISDELYDKEYRNLTQQYAQNKVLQSIYERAAKRAEGRGDVEKQTEYETSATDFESKANALWNRVISNRQNKDQSNYQQLTYQLDELKRGAEEYQAVIDTVGHTATRDDYKNIIDNSAQQIEILKQQRAYFENQQIGFSFEDKAWQDAQANIAQVDAAIASAINTQLQMNEAMANLPYEKYEDLLKLSESIQNLSTTKNQFKSTLGYDLLPEDFDTRITQLREGVANYKHELGVANGELLRAEGDLLNGYKLDDEGNIVENITEDDLKKAELNAQVKVNEANAKVTQAESDLWSAEFIDQANASLSPYKTNLEILQQEATHLQNTIDNIQKEGGKTVDKSLYQGLIDNMLGTDITNELGQVEHVNGQIDELMAQREELVQQQESLLTNETLLKQGDPTKSSVYRGITDQIEEIDSQITQGQQNVQDWGKLLGESSFTTDLDRYLARIDDYKNKIAEKKNEISEASRNHQDTSSLNEELVNLIAGEGTEVEGLQNLYRSIGDYFSTNKIDGELRLDFAKEWYDKANELNSDIWNLDEEADTTADNIAKNSESIEYAIKNLEARRDLLNAFQATKEARGEIKDNAYYEQDKAISEELQNNIKQEIEDLNQEFLSGQIDSDVYSENIATLRKALAQEEATYINDEQAQKLLPVDELKNQADEYANVLTELQNKADDFTENGGIISDDLYRNQKDSYKDLEDVYENLASEYDKLADSEKNLEKKNGFRKQAEEARESARQYREAQEDIDDTLKARQGKTTFGLLLENESDEGITKVTEQFKSQMDSIHELEEQYRLGEVIDLGEIKVQFPRVSGIENLNELPDALGEVKTDAISEYLDKYVSVISQYPDAINEAQQFLIDTMTDFDFSGVNVERVISSLTDIFGKQASKGLISEKDAFSILDQIRSILESGGDAGVAISVAMKAAFEEGYDPNSVVDDYNNLEITVKLKADVKDLDDQIAGLQQAQETNDTVANLEGSKRSLNTTERGFTIPGDYDGEITANANEMNILNAEVEAQANKMDTMLGDNANVKSQFDSFIKDYVAGNLDSYGDLGEYIRGNSGLSALAGRISSDEFTQSGYTIQSLIDQYEALNTAMTDYNSTKEESINLSHEQRDSISNENTQWADFYKLLSEQGQQEVTNITDNLGGRATKEQYNKLAEITRSEIEKQRGLLNDEIEKYPELFENGEFIGADKIDLSNLVDGKQVIEDITGIQTAIDTLSKSEAEFVGQAIMAQGNEALNTLDQLDYEMNNAVDGYDTQIKKLQADNQDVDYGLLSGATGNLDEQITQYENLINLAEQAREKFANPDSEYYNKGLADYYEGVAQEYNTSLEEAQQKQRDYGEYILNNLPSIQDRVDALTHERTRLNEAVALREITKGMQKNEQDYLAENAISKGLIQAYQDQLDAINKGEDIELGLKLKASDVEGAKSELESLINEEQQKIEQNQINMSEIAIKAYEDEATRLAAISDSQQRAISDSIRDNGYADTSLYQGLQNTLEQQKLVQDGLKALYTERAGMYEDGSKYITEYNQKAGQAADASNQFTENIQSNQKAIEDSIKNAPFQAILQNTEGLMNIQSITSDLQSVVSAVDEYRTAIEEGEEIDWTNLVNELPQLTGIAAGDIESLSSALDNLELDKIDTFAKKYSELLQNLEDPQQRAEAVTYMSNLFSDIDLSQVDTEKIKSKIQDILNNSMANLSVDEAQGLTEIQDYINSYLGAGGSEEIALMVALEAAWMGLTPADAVAEFDNLEIIVKLKTEKTELEKEITKASKQIERNNSINEGIQSSFGLKESLGYNINKEEYGSLLAQDQDNIRQAETIYNNRSRLYDISKSLFGDESAATSDAFVEMQSAYKDYLDSQEGYIQDTIAYEEANNDRYENNLSKLQTTAADIQSHIDNAVENFGTGTAEQYKFMLQNAALQAIQYGAQLSEWNRIKEENSDGKGLDNLQLYTDALEGISSVNEAMAELKASTLEWQLMLNGGIELGQLDSSLSDLEDVATAISDAGSIREGKGLTKTVSQYEALVENGENQISNLHEQNRILQRQQNTLGMTRSRWREIQSTINANNSAIAQMRGNIDGWNKEIQGYSEALGQNMLNALTNAFSESMSPTGLTTEGMNSMLNMFADLSGFDTSSIFYNTAQGIKLDVDATKMLVDAQYKLHSSDLKSQIDAETAAYKEQVDAMKNGGDAIKETARIQAEAHRQNLNNLWQQLAQYQAMYAQQQYLFSDLADVERALSSENAGAKYEQIQGYGENYQKLYESGLVGTDDYKSITALLTQYGRTTEAAYSEAKANLDRYFTEDISGVINFFNDLVSKGYATGSVQEGFEFAGVIDELKAASDLGITTEVFDYLLGRSEDYGASIQAVKSEIDGQLKLQETQHDILDSIERKNELMQDPKAATALQEEQEHLSGLREAYSNYTEGIEMEATKANQITSQQIQTGVNTIRELGEEWDKAVANGDDKYKNDIENKIREIAEKYGAIPLEEIEGKLTVDTDALKAQYEGWKDTISSSFADVTPDFVREGFDISKDVKDTDTWESAVAKVQENYSNLTEEGDTALQQLQALGLSAKELSSIDMTDGMLDSDSNLAQAEKLLDTLADMSGLTGEERQNMSSILDMFGLIGDESSKVFDRQSTITEQIQDNMETVNDLISSQKLQAEFEVKDVGDLSLQGLENQVDNLKDLKANIELNADGSEEVQAQLEAVNSLLQNNELALKIKTTLEGSEDAEETLNKMQAYSDEEILTYFGIEADADNATDTINNFRSIVDSLVDKNVAVKIQTEIEGAVDAQAKLEEMKSWDDTQIMQFLQIDADTANAEQQIASFKSQIESQDASQIPVTIRLNDTQFGQLLEALGEPVEKPVEIKPNTGAMDAATQEATKEETKVVNIKSVIDGVSEFGSNLGNTITNGASNVVNNTRNLLSNTRFGDVNLSEYTSALSNAITTIGNNFATQKDAIISRISDGVAKVDIQTDIQGADEAKEKIDEIHESGDQEILQRYDLLLGTDEFDSKIEAVKANLEMQHPPMNVDVKVNDEELDTLAANVEGQRLTKTIDVKANQADLTTISSKIQAVQAGVTSFTPSITGIDTSSLMSQLSNIQIKPGMDMSAINAEFASLNPQVRATAELDTSQIDSQSPEISVHVEGDEENLISQIEGYSPTMNATVVSETSSADIAAQMGDVHLNSTFSGIGNVNETGTITYNADTSAATSGVSEVVSAATSTPAQMNITAKNDEAKASGDEAKTYADGLTGIMTIDGNNSPALSAGYVAVGTINGMSGEITVTANASSIPGTVQSALNSQTYTVNVTANVTTNVSGATTAQTGTLLSPRAYAKGSIPNDSIVIKQGLSNGQVGLKKTQKEALVNEVGDESYITPDGQWRMFPHGMHVEKNLKKGTIILNHEQTESLIKDGKASGRGTIKGGINAFAHGTNPQDEVLMKAYAKGTDDELTISPTNVYIMSKGSVGGSFRVPTTQGGGGSSSNSGGGDSGYSGGGDSSGSGGGGGDSGDSDTPQFSYEIFDHVERALNLLARAVDNAAKKIQDYMTPLSRKNLITDQIQKLEEQFKGVNQAIETYRGYLSIDGHDMLHAYEYADDDGNKATVDIGDYFDLDDLRSGNLTRLQYIDTTDSAAKAATEGAQKWLEYLQKAEDAEDQLLDIITDIHDAALQIMEIPLDELDKTLEKLDETIGHLNSMVDIITSNGATGINMLKRAVNEGTGYQDATARVKTAKQTYTQAQASVVQTKSEIKELTNFQKEMEPELTYSQKLVNKALKKSDLSKKDRNAIKDRMAAGKKVSTKGITDKSLREAIKVWNANIETTRALKQGLKEQKAELSKNTKAQKEAKKQLDIATQQRKSIRAGLSEEERAVTSASTRQPWYIAANQWVDASTEQTRQRVEEARATLATQRQITDEQKKQSNEAGKQLLTSQNLTSEQRNQIKNGRKLDITENMSEQELKLATAYNLYFEAVDLLNNAKTQLEDTEIEYAQALMEQIEQHYNNLKDYYDDLRDWNGTLRENLESTNDLIGKTGRSYQTSARLNINRAGSMNYLETDIALAEEEIKKLQEEINKQVENGDLIVGDKTWHDRMKPIYELQVQINKTKVDIIDLYTEMANVPVEDATSKIEELRDSLKRLTTFGDKGLGDSIQLQRTYYEVSRSNFEELVKQAKEQYGKNSQVYKDFLAMQQRNLQETREYAGGEKSSNFAKTFLGQNDYLVQQVENLRQEMEIRQDTLLKTEKELQNITSINSGEQSLNAWSKNLLGERNTERYGDLINALKKYKSNGRTFYSIIKDYIDAGAQVDTNSETIDSIMNYRKLSDEQKVLLDYLISHYNAAVGKFDAYSGKLFAAETANEQALADFYEAQADYVKARANLVTNQLNNINSYMEVLYGRTKTYSDTFQDLREELQEIGYDDRGLSAGISYEKLYGEGTGQIAESYRKQIEYLEKYASQVSDSITYQVELIRQAENDGSLVKDSEEWKKAWNTINNLESQVKTTVIEIDKLYHEMQESVIFKPVKDAIDDIQRLRANISSVLDLISDDMKLTKDGVFTELGLASLTGQLSDYQSTLNEIEKTLEYQREITDEYNKKETIIDYTVDSKTGVKKEVQRLKYTTEEYTEAMQEAQKKTQDALKNAQTYRTQIINAITTRYKTEIDYINELIDKRKEAFQKQKEMNDYDKTLKSKTNEIQRIQQQIRALETLSDVESKAQQKRLEAQLQEQQQDLDDTVQEHVYDLRTEGLDDIKQELQDNYEKFSKDLQINIDSIIKTINDSAGNIEATLEGTNRVLDYYLKTFNSGLDINSIGVEEFTNENTTAFKDIDDLQSNADELEHYVDNYSAKQYETLKDQRDILESSKQIESDIYGNTEKIIEQARDYNYSLTAVRDASERNQIVTANGTVLTPLEMSDLDNGFSDILSRATKNSDLLRSVALPNTDPNYDTAKVNYDYSRMTNNVSVGSLITVNGDVDNNTLDKLQTIADGLINNPKFMEATYDYISQENARETRKRMY